MATAAKALRKIALRTTDLPADSPIDARPRDRLELAADVLDAAAAANREEALRLKRL
jgi:hypothetical protein